MRKLFRLIVPAILIAGALAPLGSRGQDARGQGRGQGGGLGRGSQPVAYDDYAGYVFVGTYDSTFFAFGFPIEK